LAIVKTKDAGLPWSRRVGELAANLSQGVGMHIYQLAPIALALVVTILGKRW
jgi:hypothetical protein